MEYEYLEATIKGNAENANFIRSIWTDKHERLLSYVDTALGYLWDIVPTERGAVIILMDSGLYEERYDETTIKRISNNCEYLKFDSIDGLEAWLIDKNMKGELK
jgi:hypothetical protein